MRAVPGVRGQRRGRLLVGPRGEFLGALGADPVCRLLGTDSWSTNDMPPVHVPVHSTLAYHLRAGGHGINAWDWEQFLVWADERVR